MIPEIKLKQLAKHASITSAYRISRMPSKRKAAILVAFVKIYETIALDDALDVFELLITKIVNDAKRIKTKKRLRSLKDLDKAAIILAKVSKLVLDEKVLDSKLRKMIFKLTSKNLISDSMETVNKLALPENNHYLAEMVEMHGKIKKVLPILFRDIEFSAAPSGEKILEVYEYLASLQFDKNQYLDNPPLDIITPPWKKLITTPEEKILKKGYTICFLNYFQDALKRRDVYVKFADRWGDPRVKLLSDNQWKVHKNQICISLGHSTNAKEVVLNLSEELDKTYKNVTSNFEKNDSVRPNDHI